MSQCQYSIFYYGSVQRMFRSLCTLPSDSGADFESVAIKLSTSTRRSAIPPTAHTLICSLNNLFFCYRMLWSPRMCCGPCVTCVDHTCLIIGGYGLTHERFSAMYKLFCNHCELCTMNHIYCNARMMMNQRNVIKV